MPYENAADQYGLIAKVLHWLIALLIIALLGIGWWMVGLSYYDPWYHDSLNWHKSLGIIVLLIVGFKVIWSFVEKSPEPQAA